MTTSYFPNLYRAATGIKLDDPFAQAVIDQFKKGGENGEVEGEREPTSEAPEAHTPGDILPQIPEGSSYQ